MEATQAIIKVILKEAKDSAKLIIQEAKHSVKDIVEKQRQRGTSRAMEETKLILGKARHETEIIKLSMTADAKMKANWTILSKKEQWIKEAKNEAKNKLEIFTKSKEYIPLLQKLIKDASIILGGKEQEVLLNEQDSALPLKLDKLSREISREIGIKTNLSISKEKTKSIGGAVVRTNNGKIVMDNTFEDVLGRREKDIRSKIAQILFE